MCIRDRCSFAQREGGEAVEVAVSAAGVLMEESDGTGGEQVLGATGEAEAVADVIGGVGFVGGRDAQSGVQAREQRFVDGGGESVVEFGEADQDDGEERAAVPFVVEEDMEVAEDVGVEQVRFVEEEDWVDAGGGELVDLGGDGVEDGGGGGLGREPERGADLTVEVAAAEGGVVAVGQAEALLR